MVLAGSERVHHLNYLVSTTYTSRNSRLRYLSSDRAGRRLVQQPNGPLHGRWAEVHVALRVVDRFLCPASFWIARAGVPRIARMGAEGGSKGMKPRLTQPRSATQDGLCSLARPSLIRAGGQLREPTHRWYTDRPLENVSSIWMCSRSAGSVVSGFVSRITRSACFPTVIEPLVSSSKY